MDDEEEEEEDQLPAGDQGERDTIEQVVLRNDNPDIAENYCPKIAVPPVACTKGATR